MVSSKGTVSAVKRRAFLGLVGGLALGGCTASLASRLPLPPRFTVPLPIPPVAKPGPDGGYELTQAPARVEIIPGTRTEVWSYGGTFPGPTLDVRSGSPVAVRVVNRLPVPRPPHSTGTRRT